MKRDGVLNLLLINKEIYREARGYMIDHCQVYVPIIRNRSYGRGKESVETHTLLEGAQFTTAFKGLTDFMNAHIHIHKMKDDPENPESDEFTDQLDWKLFGAFCTWVKHSAALCEHRNIRRRAVIHLDHYSLSGFVMRNMLGTMARDTYTDWEIKYYLPTHDLTNIGLREGMEYLKSLLRKHEGRIFILVEIYGPLANDGLGALDEIRVTREVTVSGKFWKNHQGRIEEQDHPYWNLRR